MRRLIVREALGATIGALSAIHDATAWACERLCARLDLIPRDALAHTRIMEDHR